MPSRLDIARKDIAGLFESLPDKIFGPRELSRILASNRDFWRLTKRTTVGEFTEYLEKKGRLRIVQLESEHYRDRTLYVWGDASPFELAVAIKPDSYLSHGSAVFLHGLTDQLPQRIYVNQEQSPKPRPTASLTQERIDAAFARPQRESRYIFRFDSWEILVLSGKFTNRLEVGPMQGPRGETVDTTSLERTLIDIAVRPNYAGGVHQVLAAYQEARGKASSNVLLRTLKMLDYVYPYHQAIGFYMAKTEWDEFSLQLMKREGLDFDFYLTYAIEERAYNSEWRLFYPKSLE